ncbi:MAG: nitroreductase family protein [Halobacteriota archaeon]
MELLEAIKSRKSIRAFKPDQVPREILTELLDVARWSPSSANTQPWEFFILTGEALDRYNQFLIEKGRSGELWKPRPDPDIPMFVILAKGTYAKRQGKFFKQVIDLLEPEEGGKNNGEK